MQAVRAGGRWSADGVEMVDHGDQANVPAGCTRKLVRIPIDGARKFIRFNISSTL